MVSGTADNVEYHLPIQPELTGHMNTLKRFSFSTTKLLILWIVQVNNKDAQLKKNTFIKTSLLKKSTHVLQQHTIV